MKLRVLSALMACLVSAAALAHHSFAMFDSDHQVRLAGKVTKFEWQNPHVYIEIEAPDPRKPGSKPRTWTIECANPGILNRIGWKFNMIKKDDQIAIVIAPYRTGEPAGLLKQVKLADGRIFGNGGPAGPPNISIEDGKPLPAAVKP